MSAADPRGRQVLPRAGRAAAAPHPHHEAGGAAARHHPQPAARRGRGQGDQRQDATQTSASNWRQISEKDETTEVDI